MREYSDAKNNPNPTPPVVGRDYRLSNFWLAKEVNKGFKKKEVVASVFIKNIKYYKNTNCTLKKG